MRSVVVLAALALAVSTSALAAGAFNGTIEMKITTDRGANGTVKMSLGDAGVVSEMQMTTPQGAMNMRSLMKKDKPDVVYMINDASKTYMELPAKQTAAAASQQNDDETWTVKKLGTEKIAGYDSTHVTATSSKGNNVEMWTTKGVMDAASFQRAMGNAKVSNGLMVALEKEGADGLPAKMIAKGKDGSTTTMELVKVTKGGVAASVFDIPSGYTKSAMPVGLPPDVQKKLDEKLKSMTPEQREMMQKQMSGAH